MHAYKLVTYNKTTTHTPTMFFTQVKTIASYTKVKDKGKFLLTMQYF